MNGSEATCGCPCGKHLRLRLHRVDRRRKITALEGDFGLEGQEDEGEGDEGYGQERTPPRAAGPLSDQARSKRSSSASAVR